MLKERMLLDMSDAYEQFSGLALTDEQLEELGERHAKIFSTNGHKPESTPKTPTIVPPTEDLQSTINMDDY